jgi:hypothetical protein
MRLLFRQPARGVSSMAIRATKHHMRRLMHRLDAGVTLIAAHAFRVSRSL